MECLSFKSEISDTFSRVRNFSFEEKKASLYDEEKVNVLLDAILEFKDAFQKKTEKIHDVNEKIEKLNHLIVHRSMGMNYLPLLHIHYS